MEEMKKEDRMQILKEAQSLRNHVENSSVILEDVCDETARHLLTIIWTDIQSLIEYIG